MIEKHSAIWIDFNDDNDAKIVYEDYSSELEKLFVVYERTDGRFTPFSYMKKNEPQLSLPVWSNENTKVLMASLEEAKQYLESYGATT